MKKYIAETIGTFILVFCGTGSIIANDVIADGTIGILGISVTTGLAVTAMIYAIGNISGAHINPAVSLGFLINGNIKIKELLPYILAQSLGAILASFTLSKLLPYHETLGTTIPSVDIINAFIFEVILAFILMFSILMISSDEKINHLTGIVVGGIVLLEILFAGPICGGSMNPARSLAPALVSGYLESVWIYLTAPFIGAALGAFVSRKMKQANT